MNILLSMSDTIGDATIVAFDFGATGEWISNHQDSSTTISIYVGF